jgi:hypothetical protein
MKRGKLQMVWNNTTRQEIERTLQRIPPLWPEAISEFFRPEDRCRIAIHPEYLVVLQNE